MVGTARAISRVVVAFDGSVPSRSALRVAVDEAASREASLALVAAVETLSVPLPLEQYAAPMRAVVEDAARTAVAVLGPDRVSTTIALGRPAGVVMRSCRPGDLLVTGRNGHRPVARMLLGSTSAALAGHAPCPVMVVRDGRVREHAPVLLAVDGSSASAPAVDFAADEARQRGAPLRAVLAVGPSVDAMGFLSGPSDAQVLAAEVALGAALAGVRTEYPDLAVETLVMQTHPVEALLRYATSSQLLVLGTRGSGGLRSMRLGSVCRELLGRAPCPVAVVPLPTSPGADLDPPSVRALGT